LGQQDDVAAIVEPDFEDQHSHQIPEVNVAEHGHGRRAVGREVHFRRTLRMAQVQLKRQGRNDEKRERREQREPVGWLYRLHAEDAFERCEDKGPRHQSRDEWIQDDQHAPVEADLVRIHESFNAVHKNSS
jgi:hypothetical protein